MPFDWISKISLGLGTSVSIIEDGLFLSSGDNNNLGVMDLPQNHNYVLFPRSDDWGFALVVESADRASLLRIQRFVCLFCALIAFDRLNSLNLFSGRVRVTACVPFAKNR